MPTKYTNSYSLFELLSIHLSSFLRSQSYHNAKDCTLLTAIPISETKSGGQKPNFIQTVHGALARSAESSDSTFKRGTLLCIVKFHCWTSVKELKINQTYRNDEYSSRSRLAMPWYLCSHPSHCWSYSGISHSNHKTITLVNTRTFFCFSATSSLCT